MDSYDLFNGTAGSLDLQTDILTNPLATIVVNPTDANVAATFGGGANFTTFPVLNITATGTNGQTARFGAVSAVPEPGSVALLVGMTAIGAGVLRRRRK